MLTGFYKSVGKRFVDMLLSALALLVLWPVLAVIALAIKLDSPGPVLFRQIRSGRNGEEFYICKFRSMTAKNNVYDIGKVDEVTRVGNWLRKTSLDELPQLLNVLNGDMALIGPRPWIPDYNEAMNDEQRRRYSVRPGITGLAQASGRNALTITEKIEWDLEYVDTVSLRTDMGILLQTVRTIGDSETIDIGKQGIRAEIDYLLDQNSVRVEKIYADRS